MTKQEIIAAFEQAEKDYSKRAMMESFCFYFMLCQEIPQNSISHWLKPLWQTYRTTEYGAAYHFRNREERLEAIRKVLNDLKQQDESI